MSRRWCEGACQASNGVAERSQRSDLVTKELTFRQAACPEVPAEFTGARDGETVEGSVASNLATERMPIKASALVRITPPVKDDGLDAPVRVERVSRLDRSYTKGVANADATTLISSGPGGPKPRQQGGRNPDRLRSTPSCCTL